MGWKERLITEEKDLRCKTVSLSAFMTRDSYKNLPSHDKAVIAVQLSFMKSYLLSLEVRVEDLNN